MVKSTLTKEERAFRREYDGAPFEEDELASVAAKVPGPLGVAATALNAARERFEKELERIGYEHG